jgi:hypothetical protein
MRSPTIALAGSVAARSFAAVSIAQAAATRHQPATTAVWGDRSRVASGVRQVVKTSADRSLDRRDR